ncbi:TrmH family RNA methyltransferase [Paenibacillus soyae]|uniref:RNA methyltransferase n=1 Tax=Paenibacillus soyae TaxID=2969249 RepID=A0A9X2MM75_9BACL|nr:RNA methyltransferase [Paenibacillus soyae]MCR2802293.1 RNA methyltransferase [Paenibacillus soyae]
MSMESNDLYIGSPQNDRVKGWSSLLDKKYRDRENRFIVEGVHLIQEAAEAGVVVSQVVYDSERGVPAELESLRNGALDRTEWIAASKAVMGKCTGTDTPPPVFAIVNKPEMPRERLFGEGRLVVALDGVRDPGNLGTIIRSADAAGADAVVLGKGCVDLYNPKTVRSTMGSLFHLPIVQEGLMELLPLAREGGAKLIGTSLQADHSCYGYDWKQSTWLLMGSESVGLSEEVRGLVDESVIIPMAGRAESLNVAMATTVLLFEAMRQRLV